MLGSMAVPLVSDQTSTLIRLSSNYLTRTGESTGFSRRVALIKGDETVHVQIIQYPVEAA